jgi:hypothetical protein
VGGEFIIADRKRPFIESADQLVGNSVFRPVPPVQRRDVLHVIRLVVLRQESNGLRLHAKIDILCHKNDFSGGPFLRDMVCNIQNVMVRFVVREIQLQLGVELPL